VGFILYSGIIYVISRYVLLILSNSSVNAIN